MCLVPESEDTEAELRLLRHEAEPLETVSGESCPVVPIWGAIMPPEARGLSSLWFPNRMLTLSDHPLLELQSVWALGGPNIQEQKSIVVGFQNSDVCLAHQMPIL